MLSSVALCAYTTNLHRFDKPHRNDGFKSFSQEESLLQIVAQSVQICDAILRQFQIVHAIYQAADNVHGPNEETQIALRCEEIFRQPDGSLGSYVTFLRNKANEVTESLEKLRKAMIRVVSICLLIRCRSLTVSHQPVEHDRKCSKATCRHCQQLFTGLVDKHDNWWTDISRQAGRIEYDGGQLEGRQEASKRALKQVLVSLYKFKSHVSLLDVLD